MPAPLYARYVPPKASKTPIQNSRLEADVSEEITGSPATPTPQLYARYVPPKVPKHAIESPTQVLPRNRAFPPEPGELQPLSKKRKRPEEGHVHKDRRALVESANLPIRTENVTEETRDSKKDRKEKKDKKRKSKKAETAHPLVDSTHTPSKQRQDKIERLEAVDHILAKYSVTGGSHRSALLTQKSKTNSSEPMDVDESNEDAVTGEEMDKDAWSDDEHGGESEDEQITPAGVEAIFQKYRRSTQLAETVPNPTVRQDMEERGREADDADKQEPELHGSSEPFWIFH
jgi:hypothetical protein